MSRDDTSRPVLGRERDTVVGVRTSTASSSLDVALLVFSTDSVGRDLLAVILKGRGFHVTEALDEDQARAELRTRKFGAVLFDMRPRALVEHDSAGQLMADFPNQKFVLLIDEGDQRTINGMMSAGADAILTHPFEGRSLMQVLESGTKPQRGGER